jgi:hypothetical protein
VVPGRYSSVPDEPYQAAARDAGLGFSVAAAMVIIALAVLVRWLGAGTPSGSVGAADPVIGWYLVVLPLRSSPG